MKKLSSKTALITGGTSGIGLAAARLFQQEGAHVAVTGRNPERLAEAREALGDEALIIASDAGNLTDIEALMGTVEENLGRLDVLFLNAAVAKGGPLEQVSENDFDEQIAVNVKGVFFALQKALPLLNPGASVIVTTSIANRLETPNASVYAASKAALRSLVQTLALELIGRGIRVNAVCPGPIAPRCTSTWAFPPTSSDSAKPRSRKGRPTSASVRRTRRPGWFCSWPAKTPPMSSAKRSSSMAA